MNTDNSNGMKWVEERMAEGRKALRALLSAPKVPFDSGLEATVPEEPGLYAISVKDALPGEFLWVGRTITDTLRRRIFKDHLTNPTASSDLPIVLERKRVCTGRAEAKSWIRARCVVQFIVEHDNEQRKLTEHFLISVLRPKLQ